MVTVEYEGVEINQETEDRGRFNITERMGHNIKNLQVNFL